MPKSFTSAVTSALPQSILSLMVGVSVLALAPAASAQTAPVTKEAAADTNVVIVTANKRKEPVQKVAQTVNVVSAQTLKDLHIQSFQEVGTAIGGLSLTRTSGSEQSVSLRGIKMPAQGGSGGTTNTVELYQNEVPISVYDAFTATFDIGQIEVLKGPQGTLRGRPSPSGAMTITTQKGSFKGYDGYVEGSVSDHNGRNLQAAVGGPLSDKLAFRLAGVYDANDDNQVKDIFSGKHSHHETYGLRGTLTWRPIEHLEINLMEQYVHENRDFYRNIAGTPPCQGGPILVSSVGCGHTYALSDRIALNEGTNPNNYRGKLTTLSARYDLTETLELDYVGGYNDSDLFSGLDFDFAGVGDANNFARYINVDTHVKTFTNEFRLQSNNNAFYNFTYGVFTSDAKSTNFLDFAPLFSATTRTQTKDLGVFTNQRFTLSPQDNLSLGIRYSKVEINSITNNTTRTYQSITGNGSYQHQFTPDVMGYVSYGTSYRPGSGGANGAPQAVIPASFGNFEAEHSQSTEVGLKSQWFSRRLTANVALFDQRYNGYISSAFNVVCTGVPNPNGLSYATTNGTATGPLCFGTMLGNGNAVSKGVEIELRGMITPNWSVGTVYTYTDAHFQNALLPCNDYNGDGTPDVNGTQMVQKGKFVSECHTSQALGQLPKTSVSAMTNYDFHLGSFPAYIRANAIYRDKSYFPQTAKWMPAFTQVNAFVGLKAPNRDWEVSLWVKNLLNKVVQDTDGGPWTVFNVPAGVNIGTVTNAREVGLTLRRDF